MKRILISLLGLCFFIPGLKAQQKFYPQINKVTVFKQSAQIDKSLAIELKKGYNEIILLGNSSRLNTQSIQFNSSKDFVITDFSPYIQFVRSTQEMEDKLTDKEKLRVRVIKDSIELLRDKRNEIRDRMDILTSEGRTLNNIKELEKPQKADSMSLIVDALNYYRSKNIEIAGLQYNLNESDIEFQKLIRKLKQELQIILQDKEEGENLSKEEYCVKLNLYAKNDVKTRINYRYNVSGIYWTPLYDIRFSSTNNPATFLLKAEFQQTTGEDWKDVSIVFSTEEQSTNIKSMTLKPMVYKKQVAGERPKTVATVSTVDDIVAQVGGISDVENQGKARGEGGMVTYVNGVAKKGSVNIPKPVIEKGSAESAVRMKSEDIEKMQTEIITENASTGISSNNNLLTQDYIVKMKYTIKSGERAKIIPLQEQNTKVNYKYFSVPKKEKVVYLAALFPTWEELGLANARANLYIDNKYVNSTYISANQTLDTLKVFVGRENKIAIERKIIKEKPIEANRKGTELEQVINIKILVKNNNNNSVDIKIDDQIPISNSEKISITKGELSGAIYDEKTGLLYWETSLKPLESKIFTFSYTCKYPKDVELPLD
ncbi:MAG: DUF4139 domain-containing protein [Bacteroidales bacterium]|nr:DUF4139 domain-containing protein [Bacteroidales bacterium]